MLYPWTLLGNLDMPNLRLLLLDIEDIDSHLFHIPPMEFKKIHDLSLVLNPTS
jgi:hypothetical protein